MDWKSKVNVEHILTPLSFTQTTTTAFSANYLAQLGNDPVLRLSNLPEIISSSVYNYLTSTTNVNAVNVYYFNTSFEIGGNIAGAVMGAKTPYTKTLAGSYYAQFAKADIDFRYSRKLSTGYYWANRVIIGASLPYGNSAFLPFSRQYVIGGANSLRGFSIRDLGPGSALTTPFQKLYYPQIGGDYKLEMNTEFRFPLMAPRINGALFVDAGNVWLKDTILYSTTGQLTKGFLRQLGVDAGFGIRIDINILILRLDFAFPLAKPWLPEGQRWVLQQVAFGNSSWRNANLVFNLGLGYPF